MDFQFIAVIAIAVFWFAALLFMLPGWRTVSRLPACGEAEKQKQEPLISVIVAAKEEEQTIRETLRHLMNQNAGRMEIIAVNDRSSDATGSKLEALKKWSEQKTGIRVPLRIVHITHLPAGWLGKTHALYQGYLQAKGSILLFTDADVQFQASVVSDAWVYMHKRQIDHLTLAPAMLARSFALKAFVRFFMFSLTFARPPWLANIDRQRSFGFGIGAFNMITRSAYEKIGTHQALAMRPDDDLQLGMLVKKAGLKQRFLSCTDRLQVEWYPGLQQAFRGLEKNLFAGFHYNPLLALVGVIGQLLFFLYPFLAAFVLHGWERAVSIAAAVLLTACYLYVLRKFSNDPPWDVVVLPFSVLVLVYVIIRSVMLTYVRGGMFWRGTFYSLKQLKKMYRK